MAAALQALFPKLGLSKKALLLGAGFVTKPTVQLLSDAGVNVTVGMSHSQAIVTLALNFTQPAVLWNPPKTLLPDLPMLTLSPSTSQTRRPLTRRWRKSILSSV
jgi:hypothetical protein